MPPHTFFTPLRLATFIIAVAVALTVALLPIEPERQPPPVGVVAAAAVVAPARIEFTSDVLTEEARDQAAAALIPFLTFDAGIRTAQVAALSNLLDGIDRARADTTLASTARSDAVAALPGQVLGQRAQVQALSLTASQWSAVRTRAIALLTETLMRTINAADVEATRDGLAGSIGTGLGAAQQEVLLALVQPYVQANVTADSARTAAGRDAARAAVAPVTCVVPAGRTVVEAGAQVSGAGLVPYCALPPELGGATLSPAVLDRLAVEVLQQIPPEGGGVPGDVLVAMLLLSVGAAVTIGAYLLLAQPAAVAADRRLVLAALLVVGAVAAARWYLPWVVPDERDKALDLMLPLAAVPVLVAALLDRSLALVTAVVVAALAGVAAMAHPDFGLGETPTAAQALRPTVVYLFAGIAGVFATQRVERVTQYGVTGGVVGATIALGGVVFWLLDPARGTEGLLWIAVAGLVVAAATAVLTIGAFAFLGLAFGITTRLQLLELAQLTQPLLQRLQEEAPGTFHHALLVATMSERAATQIGADALLVRVGAYYHDIGKLAKPHMYIENQSGGQNPHAALDPVESARVIQEHVHWGLELARRHRLPPQVRAFIPEHHGTRLVTYFYRKAAAENPAIDPAIFTYAGPRPQARETALVMMADSCEAVVRSSRERDVETIDRLVDGVVNERLAEHQFDDTTLTLRDIRTVADSFKVTLRGVYHPRIEYPEPTAAERARGAFTAGPPELTGAPAPTSDSPVDGTAPPTLSGDRTRPAHGSGRA